MRVFMGTAAVLSLILASTPAAARDDGLRKQVKALVKACPAAAKGYDLAALTPDGLATPDYRARFEEWAGAPDPDARPGSSGATIMLRGVIGSSITQDIRFSTVSTLWRDAAGAWQVLRVDHGTLPPVPPPPPPPELFEEPDAGYGFMIEQVKPAPDKSRRVQRGRLLPAAAAELDRLLADPCLQLEQMGLTAHRSKSEVPPCPYDYAGSTIEVTRDARSWLISTDCRRELPSAKIADILFYPQADVAMPDWDRTACADCVRYVPVAEYFRRAERTGDAATDAVIARAYAAVAGRDYAGARRLLEPLASEKSAYPLRWLLMPELAWLRDKTGDTDGAITLLAIAGAAADYQRGRLRCDAPIGNLTEFQDVMQRRFGIAQICDAPEQFAIPDGFDMAPVELARQKAGAIEYPIYSRKTEATQVKD